MAYKLSNVKGINPIGPSCRKTTYYSLEEALDMIKHISENRRVREISAYQCSICGFWHLTSKPK